MEDLNNDHALSPDGKQIYLSSRDGHLYRVAIEGGRPERVSNQHEATRIFCYYLRGISPDGTTLTYVGVEHPDGGEKQSHIYMIPA
ncbi:MAG: hypothetical protein P8O70_19295 [SAR324 cluster bacterium]|nr:hypothetical protein [SAR324 cluster bacterium]